MIEFKKKRDDEIYDTFVNLIKLGYTASVAYEKLHYLTGLEVEYIKQIRFKKQKEFQLEN